MDAIALIGTAWLAFYVAACAVWPYRSCARCSGTGKRRSPSGKAWRAGAVTALDARSGWAGGWWSGVLGDRTGHDCNELLGGVVPDPARR